MELIRNFKDLNKLDTPIAGGKGASLGEMTQAGIPVPPGFVVLADSFDVFVKEAGIGDKIDQLVKSCGQNIADIEKTSEAIRLLISKSDIPSQISQEIISSFDNLDTRYVAVRSSATAEDSSAAAWAGQLESYLNVTKENLLEKVKLCWSSLFTPRAISYRIEKDLKEQVISVAVVVQQMVESEVSGVAFSVHPVTEDHNQILIEGGYGLGEAVVSGSITPDNFTIDKNACAIIERDISNQERGLFRKEGAGIGWIDIPTEKREIQKLTDNQVIELAKLVSRIEKHYGFPCDIEWALMNNKFYIVQSRPITTLSTNPLPLEIIYELLIPEKRVTPFVLHRLNHISAVNLQKYVPDPPSNLCWFVDGDLKWHSDTARWERAAQNIVNKLVEDPNSYYEFNMSLRSDSLNLKEFSRETYFKDLSALGTKEILDLYLSGLQKYENVYERGMVPTIADLHNPVLSDALKGILSRHTQSVDEAFVALTSPHETTEILEEEAAIIELALDLKIENKDNPKVQAHSRKYFWLTFGYEGPIYSPSDVINRITKLRLESERLNHNLEEIKKYSAIVGEEYQKAVSGMKLSQSEIDSFQVAREWLFLKALRKEAFFACYAAFDQIAEEISLRFGMDKRQVKFMTKKEVGLLLIDNQKPESLDLRTKSSIYFYENGQDVVLVGKDLENILKERVIDGSDSFDGDSLKGQVAYPGLARGKVKLVFDPADMGKMEEGDILVSPATNPNILPAMQMASAFVTDIGGITCHAAIVAREMKKPCVIGTKNATKRLKDGDMVEVNALKGMVTLFK